MHVPPVQELSWDPLLRCRQPVACWKKAVDCLLILGIVSFAMQKLLCFYLFIYLFMAALGLRCCVWAFSSCGEWGLLFRCGAQASDCNAFSCGVRSLGTQAQ